MVDLLSEFPHPVDWIFRTMFPGAPESGSINQSIDEPPVKVSHSDNQPINQSDSLSIVAIIYDASDVARQCSRTFLYQSAASVGDCGGNATYIVKEKMVDIPKVVAGMPVPNIFGLKRMRMGYKGISRELARALVDVSQAPTVQPVVFCVEDLMAFCEATTKQRDWTSRRALAAMLSHFEEAIIFAKTHRSPLRIVFSIPSTAVHYDLFRRLGSKLFCLTVFSAGGDRVDIQPPFSTLKPWYSFRSTDEAVVRCSVNTDEDGQMDVEEEFASSQRNMFA
ncbi:hypothetical protein BV898_06623 [Hypsibius exemplaris]|uniref:Uncharacterized protein n=1 Tax=Hypsibius exemplaris TaxID=2072580 RepID=A0A1W0WW08_HYPEX|nr:hypothetical protein BV898_06623 [Hypsibius exemplaris]